MNGKDFAIGVLSVTAVVLLVGFLLVQAGGPQTALAAGQSGTVGEYVVTTSHVNDQLELLCILDTSVQRLNFYQLDTQTNMLVRLGPPRDVRWQQQPGGQRPPAGRQQRRGY